MTRRTQRRRSHVSIQDAVICVRAPVAVVSAPDGRLAGGAGGYYCADVRVLSRLVLTLDGVEPEPVDAQLLDASRARFRAVHRLPDDGADASVSVERVRVATTDVGGEGWAQARARSAPRAAGRGPEADLAGPAACPGATGSGSRADSATAADTGAGTTGAGPGAGAVDFAGPGRVRRCHPPVRSARATDLAAAATAADTGAVIERITVVNHGRRPATVRVALAAGCDLADMSDVRAGCPPAELPAAARPDGLAWGEPPRGEPAVAGAGGLVVLRCEPAPDGIDAGAGSVCWQAEVGPGQAWRLALSLAARGAAAGAAVVPPAPAAPPDVRRQAPDVRPQSYGRPPRADASTTPPGQLWRPGVRTAPPDVRCPRPDVLLPWSDVRVTAADPRLPRLVERALDDLAGLLLADPLQPADRFLAAGAPWYLTLFGRDALWAARMLLPLGAELAAGTLRALARRQGAADDPRTEEQPGKIPHELRRGPTAPVGGLELPPLYYGTIDATLLFVVLLAEAWRWGMPHDEVASLIPHAERALHWLRHRADPDGDGFVEYVRTHDRSLANQGWKDSPDAVQSAAGAPAGPPIALAEVQGYAYQAATAGADLLDAFGRDGGDAWREWAARLAERFRNRFWVEDADGPYVAIALDGRKRPVDAVSSNPGHLLGTGMLDAAECALVARRLAGPDMDGGWGLRTMSARSRGFNPLGYHTGSVWAHDTAIAVAGLAATGHPKTAAALLDGLLDAAAGYGYRMPELHGGHRRDAAARPAPYPASCRPQAWSAAAGISLLASLVGLRPDLPAGRVALHPLPVAHTAALHVTGLRLGRHTVSVGIPSPAAPASLTGAPPHLTVTV